MDQLNLKQFCNCQTTMTKPKNFADLLRHPYKVYKV